jgi:hypothetical protein
MAFRMKELMVNVASSERGGEAQIDCVAGRGSMLAAPEEGCTQKSDECIEKHSCGHKSSEPCFPEHSCGHKSAGDCGGHKTDTTCIDEHSCGHKSAGDCGGHKTDATCIDEHSCGGKKSDQPWEAQSHHGSEFDELRTIHAELLAELAKLDSELPEITLYPNAIDAPEARL